LLFLQRAKDGKIEIAIRLIGLVALIGLIYYIIQNPGIIGGRQKLK